MAPGSVDTAVETQSVPPPPSSIAAPAGSAYEDLRGSAESVSGPPPPSSIAAPAGSVYEDLRSTGRPVSQPAREPQPIADEPSGFDLPSAAIGAVTAAGLLIGLLAVAGVVRRRPLSRGHGTIGA